MDNPVLEIVVLFLLLLANGVFAMSEIAVVSARKARLHQLADEGNAQARAALELSASPNQFLSTVQIGITLVGILAGAFGGATIANELGVYLNTIPLFAPYGDAVAIGLVVVVITYFSLVIGELVPKRLALNNAERIAAAVAAPMRTLSTVTAPVVWFLSVSTDLVLRLLRAKASDEPAVTEEEIKVMIEQGTQLGVFEEVEQDMIERVLRLDDRRINAVMTPRPQIIWLSFKNPVEEIQRKIRDNHYSRFPVVEDDLDSVVGIVYTKDLLAQYFAGETGNLRAVMKPTVFVPESISILKMLEMFKQKGTDLALVTDEYGGIEGLITFDDILESIVGDIPMIDSPAEPEAVQRDDGSWLLDGMLPIHQLKELLDVETLPEEQDGIFHTVGGFVISQIGTIPTAGQHFDWATWRFEVVDMDERRVDKVLMMPIEGEPPASAPHE